MKLYLDDERSAPLGWTLVETVSETISMLQTGDVSVLSLDHDLGDPHETGYDVLLWIEEEVAAGRFLPPRILIHTANPAARPRMLAAVRKIYELAGR